jgi:hypothetical protein
MFFCFLPSYRSLVKTGKCSVPLLNCSVTFEEIQILALHYYVPWSAALQSTGIKIPESIACSQTGFVLKAVVEEPKFLVNLFMTVPSIRLSFQSMKLSDDKIMFCSRSVVETRA